MIADPVTPATNAATTLTSQFALDLFGAWQAPGSAPTTESLGSKIAFGLLLRRAAEAYRAGWDDLEFPHRQSAREAAGKYKPLFEQEKAKVVGSAHLATLFVYSSALFVLSTIEKCAADEDKRARELKDAFYADKGAVQRAEAAEARLARGDDSGFVTIPG